MSKYVLKFQCVTPLCLFYGLLSPLFVFFPLKTASIDLPSSFHFLASGKTLYALETSMKFFSATPLFSGYFSGCNFNASFWHALLVPSREASLCTPRANSSSSAAIVNLSSSANPHVTGQESSLLFLQVTENCNVLHHSWQESIPASMPMCSSMPWIC